MNRQEHFKNRQKILSRTHSDLQRGAVLFVSLIFLLVLTVIGMYSMQSTIMQEKMAGNARDVGVAFQAAEAALRDAERYLQNPIVGPFDVPNSGLYHATHNPVPDADYLKSGDALWIQRDNALKGAPKVPQYMIEELPPLFSASDSLASDQPLPDSQMYRITARGYGTTSVSQAVLQSVYRR